MDTVIDHGPASKVRLHGKGYPFGDKYPIMVRMTRAAKSDSFCGFEISNPPLRACCGEEYPAWTNSYGAVSAILPNGKHLGLYPMEFEVIEWSK